MLICWVRHQEENVKRYASVCHHTLEPVNADAAFVTFGSLMLLGFAANFLSQLEYPIWGIWLGMRLSWVVILPS